MFDKINQVIKDEVRPQLQFHSGDIQLLDINYGVVEVKLLGACSNCPSAKITLDEIVGNTIKKHFPEIKSVISVNETSEELIEFAKKILSKDMQ